MFQRNKPRKFIDLPLTNPAWIEANRKGILTPEQIEELVTGKYSTTTGYGCSLLIFFIVLFFVWLISLRQFPGLLLFSLLLGGVGCALIRLGSVQYNRFREGLGTGQIVLSIEKQEGEIIWDQAQTAYRGNLPRSSSRSLSGFLPGPYNFYSVREEGLIIPLEPTHTLEQKHQALLRIQEALYDTLGFDSSDLVANQQGLLSKRQRPWVQFSDPTIQFLDGEIFGETVSSGENSTTTYYYYRIQGTEFRVSETALRAIIPQVRYRAYYQDGKKKLLSVEPLKVLEDEFH